ncbi:uncharacterized protein BJ171DRAFT_521557 [Polychytrium aggregatum]|uniref:uncharacterized protein n=1 Tax=Polychytrium aggregatum TaxID=110093 RepID=UPI0022FE98A9|nr:uncharacterized protein BJ171DRAFT_521557 [Polychytrium aggregatum]KAI9197208.1 hypothetical protein BJ171DRAFT_521557 [Polychytrium aggregatum]
MSLSWLWKKEEKPVVCYHIEGFLNCKYMQNAIAIAESVKARDETTTVQISSNAFEKPQWQERLEQLRQEFANSPEAQTHKTSPFIFEGCKESERKFVGGYDSFMATLKDRHCPRPPR